MVGYSNESTHDSNNEENAENMWEGEDAISNDSPTKESYQREKKVACRYGRGCTHIADAVHQNRFWHPPHHRNHHHYKDLVWYICHECGAEFREAKELQLHIKRKTAWSNHGLVGCRVSCFVDNREWQEGQVIAFHKSGKHCVEFTTSKEKRLFKMLRTAFYIVERPVNQLDSREGEVKEIEDIETETLAPLEDWNYCEDVSIDYVKAQSLLQKVYRGKAQETGHKTAGHLCVTEDDRSMAKKAKGSLLYGELLPRGVNKALSVNYLNAAKAKVIYDLGMGLGKVAMQAFLQFPNLTRVYGVELSRARYLLAVQALQELVRLCPEKYYISSEIEGEFTQLKSIMDDRVLEFACGNFFGTEQIETVDIILFETDVAQESYWDLSILMHKMKEGSRTLTYLDLRKMWEYPPFPFRQLSVNCSLADRFPTSWSVQRGHHFFLWVKTMPSLGISASDARNTPRDRKSNNSVCSKSLSSRLSRFFICWRPNRSRPPQERSARQGEVIPMQPIRNSESIDTSQNGLSADQASKPRNAGPRTNENTHASHNTSSNDPPGCCAS